MFRWWWSCRHYLTILVSYDTPCFEEGSGSKVMSGVVIKLDDDDEEEDDDVAELLAGDDSDEDSSRYF